MGKLKKTPVKQVDAFAGLDAAVQGDADFSELMRKKVVAAQKGGSPATPKQKGIDADKQKGIDAEFEAGIERARKAGGHVIETETTIKK